MSTLDSLALLRLPLPVAAGEQPIDFAAPRLAWAGEWPRRTWMPRLAAIRAALIDVELDDVASGRVAASALECSPGDVPVLAARLRARDLAAIPLGAQLRQAPTGEDMPEPRYRLAFARRDGIDALVDAIAANDLDALLARSGHPACCAASVCAALAAGERLPLAMHAAGSAQAAGTRTPEANGLLQSLGIAASPHVACHDRCAASHALGAARMARGRALGHGEAMAWLAEALAWPLRYSRRNGVAELHAPVLRFLADAGPSPSRLDYATQAAPPRPAAPVPDVVDEAISTEFDNPDARAYGFDDLHAWRTRQADVVWEQSRRLRAAGGTLLDLACGDGYLLQLVEAETRRLHVFGVDAREAQVQRARQRLPHRADALAVGGPGRLGDVDAPVDFALLRPEDLLDRDPAHRAALLEGVFAAAHCVIAYASDHALRRHGSLAVLLAAAGLAADATPSPADISAVVHIAA